MITSSKDILALQAMEHLNKMGEEFPIEIGESYIHSEVIKGEVEFPNVEIYIEPITTEEAVMRYAEDRSDVCAHNFASYKYPGGGFLSGRIAQEEALCHVSTLYHVIASDKFDKYYKQNQQDTNDGLYRNFAIYSPGIIFKVNDETRKVNVMSVPAPNYVAYFSKVDMTDYNQMTYDDCLKDRIKFLLDCMYAHKQRVLILGAFGCGVFGNDPQKVAYFFLQEFYKRKGQFDKAIFAVPSGPNYDVFKQVLQKIH